jgi:hypothetical protein
MNFQLLLDPLKSPISIKSIGPIKNPTKNKSIGFSIYVSVLKLLFLSLKDLFDRNFSIKFLSCQP